MRYKILIITLIIIFLSTTISAKWPDELDVTNKEHYIQLTENATYLNNLQQSGWRIIQIKVWPQAHSPQDARKVAVEFKIPDNYTTSEIEYFFELDFLFSLEDDSLTNKEELDRSINEIKT